ncbi:MAG: LuxR C-terminal-related transcriptional regulator [Terracoccus sp.]
MLALLADGLVMEVVARRLGLSERTLRRRLRVLCDRVSATSTVQVIAWAARNHWI